VIIVFDQISESVYFLMSRSFDSNITFIKTRDHHILIDTGTGLYTSLLDKELNNLGSSISSITDIILTHSHIDHIGGVIPILEESSPKIYLHRAEAEPLNNGDTSHTLGDTFGVDMPLLKIEGILDEGSTLDFGDLKMIIYHTPGHSEGSIVIEIEHSGILLTGDTLFPGGSFGRVDFPTGNPKKLVESLKRISEMEFSIGLPGHMNAMKYNAKKSALTSYQLAKTMFRS
jgi:hydroxyacylglutathione hydrolase